MHARGVSSHTWWIAVVATTTAAALSHLTVVQGLSSSIPASAVETIQQGGIAEIDNFLSPAEVSRLRDDARTMFQEGHFITNALSNYNNNNKSRNNNEFDIRKDRSVCPAYIPSQKRTGPFVDDKLGPSAALRLDYVMNTRLATLRSDLARDLDRPGMAALADGLYSHEVSYTRFGPGAFLARHTDEHHEEFKGRQGYLLPTRRSLSWLVYLNEPDWQVDRDGGQLRTFPRITPSARPVGSRRRGDLQMGWLVPTASDPFERPVFLDAQRQGQSGNCALYVDHPSTTTTTNNLHNDDDDNNNGNPPRLYLTKDFRADPYLFLSTDWVVQYLLSDSALSKRFHYVDPPKSKLTEFWADHQLPVAGETVQDVTPTGGTLVLFDAVALPHQVMATVDRERWALSGWFHEAQQGLPLDYTASSQLFV